MKWICPFSYAAPIQERPDGKEFNWVLAWTDDGSLPYEICRFDGETFVNNYGDRFTPSYWRPLPPDQTAKASLRGRHFSKGCFRRHAR